MQRVKIRNALVALLFAGMIGLHFNYGSTSAHAQASNIEDPLAKVETGQCESDDTYTIAIHGGLAQLGGHHSARISYMKALLTAARSPLASGARAIDVVEAVISNMEDSGLFNAGKGAIANQAGVTS